MNKSWVSFEEERSQRIYLQALDVALYIAKFTHTTLHYDRRVPTNAMFLRKHQEYLY
jgi:hypothetical protein